VSEEHHHNLPMSSVVMAHLRALLKAGCTNEGYCHYCQAKLTSQVSHEPECPYEAAKAFVAQVDGTR
jgi:ferredoxin